MVTKKKIRLTIEVDLADLPVIQMFAKEILDNQFKSLILSEKLRETIKEFTSLTDLCGTETNQMPEDIAKDGSIAVSKRIWRK